MNPKHIFGALVALVALTVHAVRAPADATFRDWVDLGAPQVGLVPSPVDRSNLAQTYRLRRAAKASALRRSRLLCAESSIPSRWDSRDRGWVTSIKNQNPYGTCWAHSTCAALESAILKATSGAVTNDFSENHLATHDVGFACGYDDGGNNDMATALLASWTDVLDESDDPYPNPSTRVTASPVVHVQDVVTLPCRFTPENYTDPWGYYTTNYVVDAKTDNAAVDELYKRAVMDYGAVSICYYHVSANFRSDTGAYFWSSGTHSSGSSAGGHAVTLIGWDDDYPASNFVVGKQPPGKGAFLVKNSWGPTAGTNGCHWISYYDELLLYQAGAAFPQPEGTQNYGRVFQYDPCGFVAKYDTRLSTEPAVSNWCGNVFFSTATGIVEAAGFHALAAGTRYELRAYANCADTPISGTLVSCQTGLVETAGFTTVRLATPMAIGSAEKFALALRLDCPGEEYPIPVEQSYTGYCTCTAQAGESFFSQDGERWFDFYEKFDKTANVCLKAYTRFGSDGEDTLDLIASSAPSTDASITLRVGETRTFAVTLADGVPAGEVAFAWSLGDERLVGASSSLAYAPKAAHHGARVLTCRVTWGDHVSVRSWPMTVNADLDSRDYDSLQAAVDAAIAGDRVIVAPGTYASLVGPSVAIEIVSSGGPDVTVIEGGAASVCYNGALNADAVLSGFTLTSANRVGYYGGGVYGGTLTNCVIRDCLASAGGGAMSATLTDCRIENCCASDGGGAYACTLTRCVLADCTALSTGGGISDCEAECSLLTGCRAGQAGGGSYDTHLYNCTLVNNTSAQYGGGAYQDWHWRYGCYETVNTLIVDNLSDAGSAYGNNISGSGASHMIASLADVDAKFVDAANGDYRLTVSSPAVDAGTNALVSATLDLARTNRIVGGRVDIGCYEYCHVPTGWKLPDVAPDATPAEEAGAVSNAMASVGFSPSVAGAVSSVKMYNKLNTWAEENEISVASLASSSTALLSPALGAEDILSVTSNELNTAAFAMGTNATGGVTVRMKLSLAAYDAAKIDPDLLKAAVGVVGSRSLASAFSSDELNLVLTPASDGIDLAVTPPSDAAAYFLRTTVK